MTHQMLWDESFQSWAQLGVSLQPSAKLYSADGVLLREWLGPFDEDEVLALVEAADSAEPGAAQASTGPGGDRFCRFATRFARAQTDAADYASSDADGRQRIVDDLRYAANAMDQTGAGDSGAAAGDLAAAVRAYVQVIVDSGLPDGVAADAISDEAAAFRSALEASQEPVRSECAVEIDLATAPAVVLP